MEKEVARESVLDGYAPKTYKKRREHIVTVDSPLETPQEILANVRTLPGMLTHRGCCYAGCKGVVLGPIKDACTIVHGPIGCSFYTWGTRRHKGRSEDESQQNFIPYCFSTDMQEGDIVFGGEKKLRAAISEAVELFHPKLIFICSTCPVGLIGDDINAVAEWTRTEYGIEAVAFACEGYKGVSQSAGHHIANNQLIKRIIGTGDIQPTATHSVNLLGEYNIGGDGWETERLLKRCGIEILAVLTGDGSYERIASSNNADLNLVQCHRSISYIAEMMHVQYGTDWLKVNFVGITSTIKSLREIAIYFDDPALTARVEEVIVDEMASIADEYDYYKERLTGKTAAMYVGGSRSHHYQGLLRDFGVDTVLAGYEFAHRDDYEGREIIPDIKTDADSKNIETLDVAPIDGKYRVRFTKSAYENLKEKIEGLDYYAGLMKEMDKGSVVVDDLNHYETEEFIRLLEPDIFYSGIKDKYVVQKGGTVSRQLHSYDYQGPYAGFKGAINFAHDTLMSLTTPAWKLVVPPWRHESVLEGTVGGDL